MDSAQRHWREKLAMLPPDRQRAVREVVKKLIQVKLEQPFLNN